MTTDVKMPSKTLLKERLADAELKAKSPTMTVTLRIPAELNSWLDEYRHLSYPQRIEKQSLVIEALKLLYMARGKPGSPSYALDELVLTGAPPRPRRGSKRPR
jgi:hypothetical protein